MSLFSCLSCCNPSPPPYNSEYKAVIEKEINKYYEDQLMVILTKIKKEMKTWARKGCTNLEFVYDNGKSWDALKNDKVLRDLVCLWGKNNEIFVVFTDTY